MVDTTYERNDIDSILSHLIEEAGEVLAAVGKTLRWGLESHDPTSTEKFPETNRVWVVRELLDLERVIQRYRHFQGIKPKPVQVLKEQPLESIVAPLGRLVVAAGEARHWGIDHYTPTVEIDALEPYTVQFLWFYA